MLSKEQLAEAIEAFEASADALLRGGVITAARSGLGGLTRVASHAAPIFHHLAVIAALQQQLEETEEYEEEVAEVGEEQAEKPFARKMRLAREAKAAERAAKKK